ncbi:MAG: hypothetical protein K2W82_03800 [Candidatus Obscuribacterales bacterium]|nr:hypothetical protein [Candidatus Obscuribacterales bacterium]
MSFSDDQTSPAAPFSGDSSGAIFDLPDMIAGTADTSEHIVDTQSGFLVIVKHQDNRCAFSVKRRLGTPPSSSVTLTPDESIKLSKILVGVNSFPSDELSGDTFTSQFFKQRRERRKAYQLEVDSSFSGRKKRSANFLPALSLLAIILALFGFGAFVGYFFCLSTQAPAHVVKP